MPTEILGFLQMLRIGLRFLPLRTEDRTMMIGNWYCDFTMMNPYTLGEGMVLYWSHGPRKCNECHWMIPDSDSLLWRAS
jgi:hypothetical protein